MSYIVGRVSGGMRIDPDAGGQDRPRKRERHEHKEGGRDSVEISEEARSRSRTESAAREE